MTYFLDTNVIIDLLNGNSNVLASFKNAYTFDIVKIPDLVYYEVKCTPKVGQKKFNFRRCIFNVQIHRGIEKANST